jgi:uncharacterized protein HemX
VLIVCATDEAGGTVPTVTPVQQAVLGLEAEVVARRLSRAAALNQAYTDLGLSETRYFQQLIAVLDDADALVEYPTLVNRLNRLRERSRRARR